MIKHFDVNFVHSSHDENVLKYVTKKLGRLDRFIPKNAHESARAEIFLKEEKASDGRDCTCEVNLHLPHVTLNVSETSLNMYTAVDIVELKLKQQITKYKEMHNGSLRRRLARRLASRLMKRTPAPAPVEIS